MKKLPFFLLASFATAASAQQAPSVARTYANASTCAAVQAFVKQNAKAIVQHTAKITNVVSYELVFASPILADKGAGFEPYFAPTSDNPNCRVGYVPTLEKSSEEEEIVDVPEQTETDIQQERIPQ